MLKGNRCSSIHNDLSVSILLAIIVSFSGISPCFGQSNRCAEKLTTETDSLTGARIIRAATNILISEDGGKTGFALFGFLVDSTLILTVKTVGAGACVNEGDRIAFIFNDSAAVDLTHMGQFNCEAKSSIYFNDQFNNFGAFKMLSQATLSKLTVWTRSKSLTRTVDAETASRLKDLLSCFVLRAADSIFVKPLQPAFYTRVEQQPEFAGGIDAMLEFIKQNLRYPAITRRMGVQGTVYVQFLINTDGVVTDVKTIRGVHPEIDVEAERVIKLMPPWTPARQDGKPVTVQFVLPISFKLS